MPSCVVKNCRNRTGSQHKGDGITFHRFPTNELWKTDWIEIIRKCRNENGWKPSKTSVICSEHFAPNDIYKTKGGLLRIVTYAVPRKLLRILDRRSKDKQKNTITHVANPPTLIKATKIKRHKEENSDDEHDDSNNADEDLPDQSQDSEENCSTQQDDKSEMVTVTQNAFGYSSHQVFIDPLNIKQENVTSANNDSNALGELEVTWQEDSESHRYNTSLDTLLSDLSPLRRKCLKEHINNMQTKVKDQRTKIRLLNQQVRRLEVRNKTLKTILKKVAVIRREKTGCKLPKGVYQTEC